MTNRVKIVTDASDLVPLIRIFNSKVHKRVFDELLKGWKTKKELEEVVGEDVARSLELLRRGKLIEGRWRTPKNGEIPKMEFETAYPMFQADFQCTLKELGDLINIALIDWEAFRGHELEIMEQVKKGNRSIRDICRELALTPRFLKGVIKRSSILSLRGQRVEMVDDAAITEK
ncbi:MAG: ArsR transcriptional regulator [Candidatus Methanolliviera sp. GoM_oil]|nr:MAG: ArsR transcriptional regulator [Candidatus Methanolliviera sp. GoM_oil]